MQPLPMAGQGLGVLRCPELAGPSNLQSQRIGDATSVRADIGLERSFVLGLAKVHSKPSIETSAWRRADVECFPYPP